MLIYEGEENTFGFDYEVLAAEKLICTQGIVKINYRQFLQ